MKSIWSSIPIILFSMFGAYADALIPEPPSSGLSITSIIIYGAIAIIAIVVLVVILKMKKRQ